jgi:hypothetical protein
VNQKENVPDNAVAIEQRSVLPGPQAGVFTRRIVGLGFCFSVGAGQAGG